MTIIQLPRTLVYICGCEIKERDCSLFKERINNKNDDKNKPDDVDNNNINNDRIVIEIVIMIMILTIRSA